MVKAGFNKFGIKMYAKAAKETKVYLTVCNCPTSDSVGKKEN